MRLQRATVSTLRQCRYYATPPRSPFTAATTTSPRPAVPRNTPPPPIPPSVPIVKTTWDAPLGAPVTPAPRHPRDRTTWEAYNSLPYRTKLQLIFTFTIITSLAVSLPDLLGMVKDKEGERTNREWRGQIFGSIPAERGNSEGVVYTEREGIVAEGKSEIVPS